MRILLSWVGDTDLRCSRGDLEGVGPVARTVDSLALDRVELLASYQPEQADAYVRWLRERTPLPIGLRHLPLDNPTKHEEIFEQASAVLQVLRSEHGDALDLTIHLSSGTPAMHAVWLLLGLTRYPARLVQSSLQMGVEYVRPPFELSLDYIPQLYRRADERLLARSTGEQPSDPAFASIVHRSPAMQKVIERARRVAVRSVPVVIEGESGTGKELLAKAIHDASPRRTAPFVAINCGAIPTELVESTFFGHVRGAFTGAVSDQLGRFEAAHGGTLFLDEIGELPLPVQVKLLRALQERRITRVGEHRERDVDVRIVAATHRNLLNEVRANRFREDLFYRLAVAVVRLPPLREREGDLNLLVDHLLKQINDEAKADPGATVKELSPGARRQLLAHLWPGNVRELQNTLTRAIIWSPESRLSVQDIEEALLESSPSVAETTLGRPLPIALPMVVAEVKRHYLERALHEAGGVKAHAAELVGLSSANTLRNWLRSTGLT